ncbi:type 1 glutamine amidotransferase [Virgibacillus oceani]
MRIHALINYSIADLGMINNWAVEKGHIVTTTEVYENNQFPNMDKFDLLIILGGIVGAYEEDEHPWLKDEKKFIREAIESNKAILGICLGSQLIAEVLGGKVYPHEQTVIGWWPIRFLKEVENIPLFSGLKRELTLFQYHGDTFQLPEKSQDIVRLAENDATKNQAYIFKDRVVGLQFHPEFSEEKLHEIVSLHGHEIHPGPYTQLAKDFLGQLDHLNEAKTFLFTLLDNFEKKVNITRRKNNNAK